MRTQIAALVATIASIEIPNKQWQELVPLLCSNATHTDAQVKLTSLQTLGFICEELVPEDLEPAVRSQVIHCLTSSINAQEGNGFAATTIAAKGLLKSISFASQNFQVQVERDFIMNKIFEALEAPADAVREAAMQTLVELAYTEYNSIEFYLAKIAQVTEKAANHDDESIGLQGIEFWTTLTEQEIYKESKGLPTKGYVRSIAASLIQLMLQNIVKIDFEDDDEEDEKTGVQ